MANRLPFPDRIMTTSPVFVLTGFASEYSLEGIGELLRQAGEEVVEVDFSLTELPNLGAREVVFITSQHPARTAWTFRQSYGQAAPYNRYLSPMECMMRLKIRCAVLIPHDLEQPIIPDEIGYLSLFDYYCSPYDFEPGLPVKCRPIHTGWAKYVEVDTAKFSHQSLVSRNGVFFVNNLMETLKRGGARYLLDSYPFLVQAEIPLKLPRWPEVEDLEITLAQAGAKIVPSSTSSTRVIACAHQVLANAEGSVLAEATYLGVPAVILPPGMPPPLHPAPKHSQRRPFDFQLMMDTIRKHLAKGIESWAI